MPWRRIVSRRTVEVAGGVLLLAEGGCGDDARSRRRWRRRGSGAGRGPRASRGGVPSVWRSSPAWGIRSRRLRWRGGRRRRGLAMPAPRRIRWTLTRLTTMPSPRPGARRGGCRWPRRSGVRASSRIRVRSASSIRRGRGPAAVAVDEARPGPRLRKRRLQPPDRALGEPEQGGRLGRRHSAGEELGQDPSPVAVRRSSS